MLFVQKWDDKLCPKVDDYNMFFATQQEPSKDNSGEKIFVKYKSWESRQVKKNKEQNIIEKLKKDKINLDGEGKVSIPKEKLDEYIFDDHSHLIVKHDLFNHDGLTQDGIAEAFIEFAKKEKLSFVGKL